MTLSITKLCHYAECHCAERHDLFIGMLNVIMLKVIMLCVVRLNVVLLTVVAPFMLSGTPMTDILLVKFKSKKISLSLQLYSV